MKLVCKLFLLLSMIAIFGNAATAIIKYKVKSGDSLYSIAKKNHTTVAKVRKANGLKKSDRLKVGMVLKIPSKTSKNLDTFVDLDQISLSNTKTTKTKKQSQVKTTQKKKPEKNVKDSKYAQAQPELTRLQKARIKSREKIKARKAFMKKQKTCINLALKSSELKEWGKIGFNSAEAEKWNCAGVDAIQAKKLKKNGINKPTLIFDFQQYNNFELSEAIDLVKIGVSSKYKLDRWMHSNKYSQKDVIQWKNQIIKNRKNAQTYANIKMYSTVYDNPQLKVYNTNDGIYNFSFAGLSGNVKMEPKIFGPIVQINLSGYVDDNKFNKILTTLHEKYELIDDEFKRVVVPPITGYQELASLGYSDAQIHQTCRMVNCFEIGPEVVKLTQKFTFRNDAEAVGDLIVAKMRDASDKNEIWLEINFISKLLVDSKRAKEDIERQKLIDKKIKEDNEMNAL